MKEIHALEIEGLLAAQSENIYQCFSILRLKLLAENNLPKQIVEIGTCRGGFAVLLKKTFPEAEVFTFDIDKSYPTGLNSSVKLNNAFPVFEKYNIKFEEIDVFNNVEKIKNIIQKDGLSLVFCDGANKPQEFFTFSEFLKNNDLIFAHDYIDTEQNFAENYLGKIWNWHETRESDLQMACEQNKLEPFMQNEFSRAVWACRVKK